jgi:hypothetical protein
MATRRTTFRTGTPAIPTPRALDLRVVQQALDSIRERFTNAEQQLAFLQSVADANVATGDLTLMKQQLAALTNALNVLVAQVAASTDETDVASLSLTMESKMRHIARAAVRDLEPPNSANAILMARMFNRR